MAGKYGLPCISCGQELENIDCMTEVNQPYNGTAFNSYGHYGSTAFDDFEGYYLEINICDACLILHRDRVLIGRDKRPIKEEGNVVGWEDTREQLVPWFPEKCTIDDVLKVTIRERDLYPIDEQEEEQL